MFLVLEHSSIRDIATGMCVAVRYFGALLTLRLTVLRVLHCDAILLSFAFRAPLGIHCWDHAGVTCRRPLPTLSKSFQHSGDT